MVFFVRITVNQSHLRPICKSTKFNPKIQRTIYLINFQQLRLHVPDFIRTVVILYIINKEMKEVLIVSIGSFFGGGMRYWVSKMVQSCTVIAFPLAA